MPRLNATISEKVENVLKLLAEETGKTKSEVLRESIVIRNILEQELKEGKKIGISSDGKTIDKELILTSI